MFVLTVREAQHHRNISPQFILHQRGLPTTVGSRLRNHPQLLLPQRRHAIPTKHRCTGPMAILYTDVGGGPTANTTILDQVGTTLHLVRVRPSQMRVLQRAGTHPVPFLQHQDWLNKTPLENDLRRATTAAGRPQPTDGEVPDAKDLFFDTHRRPPPQSPKNRKKPTSDHQNRWRTSQKPSYRRSLSGTQRTQSHRAARQGTRQLVDATPTQGTQVPPTAATTRPTDGHTHHMLALVDHGARHAMAHHPAACGIQPRTDGPRYPRTAPVAAHALQACPGRCTSHRSVGPVATSEGCIPRETLSAKHSANSYLVKRRGAQCHTRSPRIPREATLLTRRPGEADDRIDYVPAKRGVPAPVHIQLPRTRA